MKRFVVLLVALCMMLSGCSLMDGEYLSVTPHELASTSGQSISQSASNYEELKAVLEAMVGAGAESTVISVAKFKQNILASSVRAAVNYIQTGYPLGSWAVEKVEYEIGTGGGQPVVSVNISYIHGRSQIRRIQKVQDMEAAENKISDALKECSGEVVLLVGNYKKTDIVQLIEDYTEEYPNTIMEMPAVSARSAACIITEKPPSPRKKAQSVARIRSPMSREQSADKPPEISSTDAITAEKSVPSPPKRYETAPDSTEKNTIKPVTLTMAEAPSPTAWENTEKNDVSSAESGAWMGKHARLFFAVSISARSVDSICEIKSKTPIRTE